MKNYKLMILKKIRIKICLKMHYLKNNRKYRRTMGAKAGYTHTSALFFNSKAFKYFIAVVVVVVVGVGVGVEVEVGVGVSSLFDIVEK